MTENVRKRSSKWDVVQETSIPTDKHYSSEENQDTNHDKTSNLGLSDSKNCTGQDVKCSVAGPKDTTVSNNSGWSNWDLQSTNHDKTSNLEFGGSKICNSQEHKWSDGGPKDTTVSNNSGWSSWDLQSTNHDKTSNRELGDSKICNSQDPKRSDIGPKDTTISNDSGWPSWDLQSTNHDKASNWELGDSKICNSQDLKWSDGGPKDTTVSNNSGWSSWNLQSTNHARKNNTESRDGHDISSTMKTSAGYRSMSPGINVWRQSHSRSPKRGWSKSCRSRSRSSSRSFNHENDEWNNRRGNQGRFLHPETSDHGDGSHSNSGPTENRVSRQESGWSTGQVDSDMFSDFHGERSYSRDRPFHGERKRQDLESDKRILCFNFKKGRCGRGSTCKYAHHGGSTEDPEGEKRNPCFNFMEGRCVRGSTCKYSHHGGSTGGYGAWQANEITKEKTQDGNGSVLPSENHQRHASRRHNNRELPLCKFFAEGCCRKGASCLFPHLASENENHSLRPTDDRWGQRANNGNNLRGACNSEQADTEMENAPESPKWRYDNGRRVDISDSQKFLDRNRDQHAYCVDVEESRLNHKVLPPWNPPQTYPTLPSKTLECPFPGGKQDTTIQVPNSHQLVSNSDVIMMGNADGTNFSASRLPSIVTGSAPGFNLNEMPYQKGLQPPSNPEFIQMGMGEQPHQMGPQAPPNPQFLMQMGMGDAITKRDTKGSNSIQIAAEAAIAQNLVTSEQVSQVENISASLAHIFATGQQLPQLYASLNPRPAAGLMRSHAFSHPKFARPLKLMGVQLVHPNLGSLPQSKQCDPISDSFEPSIPPGYELDMNKPQNVSAEESLEPAKILVPLPRTPEYDDADPKRNCETKENGNFNNENHHLGNPVMSRHTKAKEINAVGGKGEAGQETYSSKETVANDGQHEEDSMKNKEAKGLKLFKFALVEFVKEMLKPTWREGQMSKEAHKTIVKKVVDKVTGTLQGPQIPQTQEKIDHYLVFSKAKLERLVQGYVEKYMKA